MKQVLLGGLIGFLIGGYLGAAAFGPPGLLVGSLLGIPLGALIMGTGPEPSR